MSKIPDFSQDSDCFSSNVFSEKACFFVPNTDLENEEVFGSSEILSTDQNRSANQNRSADQNRSTDQKIDNFSLKTDLKADHSSLAEKSAKDLPAVSSSKIKDKDKIMPSSFVDDDDEYEEFEEEIDENESVYAECFVPSSQKKDTHLPVGNFRLLNLLCWPIELIGHLTLTFINIFFGKLHRFSEDTPRSYSQQSEDLISPAPKEGRKKTWGDFLLSVVGGVLISLVLIYPLLRYLGREIYTAIAESTVRKIGQSVSIRDLSSGSQLLPLLSEHILFPEKYVIETADGDSAETVPADNSN